MLVKHCHEGLSSPANLDLRAVAMSAAHALAALNAYRKIVPVERYGPAVREAYAAKERAIRERLERKMEALLRGDG